MLFFFNIRSFDESERCETPIGEVGQVGYHTAKKATTANYI